MLNRARDMVDDVQHMCFRIVYLAHVCYAFAVLFEAFARGALRMVTVLLAEFQPFGRSEHEVVDAHEGGVGCNTLAVGACNLHVLPPQVDGLTCM